MQQAASVGTVEIEVQRRLQQLEHGSLAGRPALRDHRQEFGWMEARLSVAPGGGLSTFCTCMDELNYVPPRVGGCSSMVNELSA